jgi:Tfp pilus assembly protein PilE
MGALPYVRSGPAFEAPDRERPQAKKGLKPVELVAVIVILGILAAIAVPSYHSLRRRNDVSAAAADLRALVRSIDAYRADRGTYVGMTPGGLRSAYDRSLVPERYSLTRLSATSYCARATVHGAGAYKAGPSGRISTGGTACP